jgi:DNA processing protein
MESSLKFLIALSMVPSIGAVTARKLISYLGSAEAVFGERKELLMKIPGIGEVLSKRAISGAFVRRAEEELEYCEKNGIKILDFSSDLFPVRLKQCSDSPLILFCKGDTELNSEKVISIVGTRRASREGIINTGNLIKEISQNYPGTIIVSGLAYGIDYNAHLASVKANLKTIAVLGHGLHTLYPSQHKNLASKIINQGCLLTEFTSEMNPERNNFIKRNRLIAGLADATIVVESGYKGGALITADIASSYHRDVFTYPGRITDEYSKGCNRLIKENKAALIEGLEDLEFFMNWQRNGEKTSPRQKLLFVELTDEEEKVLNLIKGSASIGIDTLSIESGIPVHKLSSILLNLEFEGIITVLPGNIYRFA